jgi:predicted transcriptional regulator
LPASFVPDILDGMTSKDIAIKTIQELPDSATWEDIEERVRFLAAIDKGLADIKAGRVVPHEEVKESLRQWLSK